MKFKPVEIQMSESVSRTFFPRLASKLEHQRETVMSRPLTMKEINNLLSMKFNNQPIFESIEEFLSEEFKKALSDQLPVAELEKIQHFRPATAREANLLFCDIHSREEKLELGSNGQTNN